MSTNTNLCKCTEISITHHFVCQQESNPRAQQQCHHQHNHGVRGQGVWQHGGRAVLCYWWQLLMKHDMFVVNGVIRMLASTVYMRLSRLDYKI